jgi:hypothetical protein
MKATIFLLLAILLLFSCQKFEDGPKYSLYTKKERLTNKWQVDSVHQLDPLENTSTNISKSYPNSTLTFEKDNNYNFIHFNNNSSQYTINRGTWSFSDSKSEIILDGKATDYNTATKAILSENEIAAIYRIRRLKKDEMSLWISQTDGSLHHLFLSTKE